jgi:hypothetical protein
MTHSRDQVRLQTMRLFGTASVARHSPVLHVSFLRATLTAGVRWRSHVIICLALLPSAEAARWVARAAV